MKVLFINDFKGIDYLNDCVFHGGRSLLGNDIVDSTYAWYLYNTLLRHAQQKLYGFGFNIRGKLEDFTGVDRENIEQKIQDKFYDLIIYGSVRRNLDYFPLVTKVYKKEEIILIDGEDDTKVRYDLVNKGLYFKREIYGKNKHTIPIGFAIPKSQIVKRGKSPEKEKTVGMSSHYQIGYTFSDEQMYNLEYQKSYFGLTQKKAGWDCMRHYEIAANGALPVFKNYHLLPKNTMTLWDRELIKDIYELFWNFRPNLHGNLHAYEEVRNRTLDMVETKLTTEKLFQYIISKV